MCLQVHSRHSGHECTSKTRAEGWMLWLSPFSCVVKEANAAVSVHVQYPAARCFLLAQVCKLPWLAQNPAVLVDPFLRTKQSQLSALYVKYVDWGNRLT